MGFFLGDVLTFVTKKVTDSDRQIEHVRIHININTVVTCPSVDLLYDATGKLNKERLSDFVQDKSKQIVGWFRFRHNSSLMPTMRDRVLHKELASYFSSESTRKEELFVACILNTSISNMGGTHKFRHVFLRHKSGMFEAVPLRINNLGDDASRHDGSDYKPIPVTNSSDESDVFNDLVQSLDLDILKASGVELVTAIQKKAEKHLNTLIPQVCESDREVANLEKQVHELRAKIFSWKTTSRTKSSDNIQDIISTLQPGQERTEEDVQPRKKDKDSISKNDQSKNCDEIGLTKDTSSSTDSFRVSKERNAILASLKSVNQGKTKNPSLSKDSQSSSQDPFANIVSEMKMDITETATSSRAGSSISGSIPGIARPFTKEESKEPKELNEFRVDRGRGRSGHGTNFGTKKAKRTNVSKSSSERYSTPSQSSDVDGCDPNAIQDSPTSPIFKSQARKKNDDNICSTSDSPDY